VDIYKPTRVSQMDAARFCGLTWAEYLALPGSPRWVNPHTGTLSKCEVFIYYMHSTLEDAFRREKETEQS